MRKLYSNGGEGWVLASQLHKAINDAFGHLVGDVAHLSLTAPATPRSTVRTLGEGPARLMALKPGTKVASEGPYGMFTDASRTTDKVVLPRPRTARARSQRRTGPPCPAPRGRRGHGGDGAWYGAWCGGAGSLVHGGTSWGSTRGD